MALIGKAVLAKKLFKIVDDGRTTDVGPWVSYKLAMIPNLSAFSISYATYVNAYDDNNNNHNGNCFLFGLRLYVPVNNFSVIIIIIIIIKSLFIEDNILS